MSEQKFPKAGDYFRTAIRTYDMAYFEERRMSEQEYTMRRDMLRDAIRKVQGELDGLKRELSELEGSRK